MNWEAIGAVGEIIGALAGWSQIREGEFKEEVDKLIRDASDA